MIVPVTITLQNGKRDVREIGSADEFRRLLEGLNKRTLVAVEGRGAGPAKQWRNDPSSWPWNRSTGLVQSVAPGDGASHDPAPSPVVVGGDGGGQRSSVVIAALGGESRGDVAERVERLRSDVEVLGEQVEPLRGQIDEVSARLEQRLERDAGALRRELGEALREEIRPVNASLAELTAAMRERPLKREVSEIVDEAFAPAEQRIAGMLRDLKEENALLAEVGDDQRRRIRAYHPGTIEELRQQVAALKQTVEGHRAEVTQAHIQIDRLERDNAHLRAATGAVDRDELVRLRSQLAAERDELESRKQLAAQRDELLAEVAEFKKVEDRYRTARDAQERDLRLEEQLRTSEQLRAGLEADLATARDNGQTLQRRLDRLTKHNLDLGHRNEEHAEKHAALAADHQRLTELVTALERSNAELTADRQKLAEESRELIAWRRAQEEVLEQRQRQHDDDARAGVEAQDRQHQIRMAQLEAEHARRHESLESQVRAVLKAQSEAELREARRERDEANEDRERLATDVSRLSDRLGELRRVHVAWEANQHERELELTRHMNAVADLTAQRDQLRVASAELREQMKNDSEERERLFVAATTEHTRRLDKGRAEVRALEETLAALEARERSARDRLADVDRQYRDGLELVRGLQGERLRLQEPAARDARVKSMKQPIAGFGAAERPRREDGLDELTWLAALADEIQAAEFVFPRRLLESFHTSLKIPYWSPLTVLAGMSGTGKSALSRLYAHFGGLRFHMVPVQPNWDSPQDLFGFFNHIDGLYKATPLLRAVVQSQRPPNEGGFDDGLLLLGLDEMNLARVEHYGSELLSRWEARRDGATAEALELDIGQGEHEPVKLGPNVFWVGTMNEDDTTLSLSDKVLERGNVITFPRPRALQRRARVGLGPAGGWLSARTFASWTVDPSRLAEDVRRQIKDALEEVNRQLGLVHRSVSHRILQAIENYVANHPRVRASGGNGRSDTAWQEAFADQLVQRVMPKLRGLDNHAARDRQCLDGLEKVLATYAEELIGDFHEARKSPTFLWASANYLLDPAEER